MEIFDHLPFPALLLKKNLTVFKMNTRASVLLDKECFFESPLACSSLWRKETLRELQDAVTTLDVGEQKKTCISLRPAAGTPFSGEATLSLLPDADLLLILNNSLAPQCKDDERQRLNLLEKQYEYNPAGILLVNAKLEMISYNQQFLQMWNIPPLVQKNRDDNESLQIVLEQLKYPDAFLNKVYELYENPEQSSTDEVELKNGRTFYRHSYPIYAEEKYLARVWYFLDITLLKTAQRKIDRQQRFQHAVLEHIQDGIVACNEKGKLSMFNRASRQIHGIDLCRLSREEWSRHYHLFHKDGTTPMQPDEIPLARALAGEKVLNEEMIVFSQQGEKRELRASGQAMFDNDGNKLGAVITLHDITDLNLARKTLHYQAYHDTLTGLPNRRMFHDLLEQNIRRARRNEEKTAVLFLDMDNFKLINDSHGHAAGDQLLIQLATLLRLQLRDSDLLCRWGGDEFLIALLDIGCQETALKVAEKICVAVKDKLADQYRNCKISTSIGISLYPDHGLVSDLLIRKADMAMYFAKEKGKNQSHFAPEDGTTSEFLSPKKKDGNRQQMNSPIPNIRE